MTDTSPNFIVIYGALRSGTTLLRLMIDGHPQLECPGEMDFAFDHVTPDGAGGWTYDPDVLMTKRIFRAHQNKFPNSPEIPKTPDAMLSRIANASTAEDPVVMVMLHRSLSRAIDCYPNLRVIHMRRDPRDVARSSIGMGWAGDVYHGVGHWMKTEAEYHDTIQRLPTENILEMSYEQLIENPEATLRQISDFCGVNYTADMLNYDSNSTYGKPDTNLTYQWKRKQSAYEVGLVEGRIGPMLAQSGYAPSGHPVIDLQGAALTKLRWQNRKTRLQGRIKRYGIKDTALVMLGNKLGLSQLTQAAQLRIDKVDIARLK